MYRLLRRVKDGLLDPILATLEEFIEAEGAQRIAGLQQLEGGLTPTNYVDCISDLHGKFKGLVGPLATLF